MRKPDVRTGDLRKTGHFSALCRNSAEKSNAYAVACDKAAPDGFLISIYRAAAQSVQELVKVGVAYAHTSCRVGAYAGVGQIAVFAV